MADGIIVHSTEGERLNVVGDRIRIIVDSKTSDGRFTLFEDETDPGCGPPLHRHGRDDEFFYVIEGTVKFVVNGDESVVTAGGSAFSPRGSIHTFANVGDKPCRMLIMTSPGGLEVPFRETDRRSRTGPLTPEQLGEIFASFDLHFLGPPLLAR